MPTREWVQSEYIEWESALSSSTPENFKLHPAVRRMLSLDMEDGYDTYYDAANNSLTRPQWTNCEILNAIGTREKPHQSPAGLRFIYWALKILAAQPVNIVEIGGGVGQLFATLRLLGYAGKYQILDLSGVQAFQRKYLAHVGEVLRVNLDQEPFLYPTAMCVSCYALGEFTDELRRSYIDQVVSKCPKGLIVWNPGDYATPEISLPFPLKIEPEVPLTGEGNRLITWGF